MIYCFDLDKTICTQEPDFDLTRAKPIKERVFKVNKLYDEGHTIIIDTARGSNTGIDWCKFTEQQLKNWGIKYHELRVGKKIFADRYIDDRGISDVDFFNKK